jgi:peptidyl-prolyl cis-trans isomerase B (cyclophilin B)
MIKVRMQSLIAPLRLGVIALQFRIDLSRRPLMRRFACLGVLAGWLLAANGAFAQNPIIVIDTSKGKIECELFADKAPNTVKNILQYVEDKHYDGVIFHRVISDFMIQGGGFDADMKERKTRDSIKNESTNGLSNVRGALAMARTPDPHSASAQFYINVKDNPVLDKAKSRDGWGYCVFGKVTNPTSMEVVDAIRRVPTTTRGEHENVPQEPVFIRSIRKK